MFKQTPPRHRKHRDELGGSYFITFNTFERDRIEGPKAEGPLGIARAGGIELNVAGEILQQAWQELPVLFRTVEVGDFVVMPDHFHGVIHLKMADRRPHIEQVVYKPLSQIIGALKTISSKRINEALSTPGKSFWQRGFYDRIVRDERIKKRVELYIKNNPLVLHRRVAMSAHVHSSGRSRPTATMHMGGGKGRS